MAKNSPAHSPEIEPVVVCRNVNVFYGDKQAINNISLDIQPKTITSFIGPSGCGKSTFLRTLNRMNDTIDGCRVEGEILIDNTNIYHPDIDVVPLRARVVSSPPVRSTAWCARARASTAAANIVLIAK